jgi:hypothetical protein
MCSGHYSQNVNTGERFGLTFDGLAQKSVLRVVLGAQTRDPFGARTRILRFGAYW